MAHRIELATDSKGRIDIGFVTMREDEAKSILSRLPVDCEARGTRTYDLATVLDLSGESLRVAHVRCRDQGPDEAELTTRALIADLAPRWIILLGIAGTVPNEDLCLGDVAISSLVYDTRLSMNAEGGVRNYALRQPRLHDAAKDLVARLPSTDGRLGAWQALDAIGHARPSVSEDVEKLVGDVEWKKKVAGALRFHFGNTPGRVNAPVVHAVPFASGSELTKDPQAVQSWLHGARDAKAIEMELVGALRACEQGVEGNDVPLVSVRGISDVVGLKREPIWTQYACDTSAAFAVAWIKSGAFSAPPAWLQEVSPAEKHGSGPAGSAVNGPVPATNALELLRLGELAITPKLVSPRQIEPLELFQNLAAQAKSKGKRRILVGWNVRPVQHLGAIHFAYLQQLSRLAQWGFKIRISVYDVCTTEDYSKAELKALLDSFERQLLRFRHIQPGSISRIGRLLQKHKAADVAQELFRLARPSLGQVNPSANDPATSLDNLLCMAVEGWERIDVLLAGGRDANDFWAQYRSRMHQQGGNTGLSLVLNFPKLEFSAGSSPESLSLVPHSADGVEQIAAKLEGLSARQLETIWYAVLAPCKIFPRPQVWQPDAVAVQLHACFRTSPFFAT